MHPKPLAEFYRFHVVPGPVFCFFVFFAKMLILPLNISEGFAPAAGPLLVGGWLGGGWDRFD